jgi:hypothetical protein
VRYDGWREAGAERLHRAERSEIKHARTRTSKESVGARGRTSWEPQTDLRGSLAGSVDSDRERRGCAAEDTQRKAEAPQATRDPCRAGQRVALDSYADALGRDDALVARDDDDIHGPSRVRPDANEDFAVVGGKCKSDEALGKYRRSSRVFGRKRQPR